VRARGKRRLFCFVWLRPLLRRVDRKKAAGDDTDAFLRRRQVAVPIRSRKKKPKNKDTGEDHNAWLTAAEREVVRSFVLKKKHERRSFVRENGAAAPLPPLPETSSCGPQLLLLLVELLLELVLLCPLELPVLWFWGGIAGAGGQRASESGRAASASASASAAAVAAARARPWLQAAHDDAAQQGNSLADAPRERERNGRTARARAVDRNNPSLLLALSLSVLFSRRSNRSKRPTCCSASPGSAACCPTRAGTSPRRPGRAWRSHAKS
jgi:hypothetical protein